MNITSGQVGTFSGTAALAGNSEVSTTFSVTFVSGANTGTLVGSETVWLAQNKSLDYYLRNYQIIAGHRYLLVSNHPPTETKNCSIPRVFSTSQQNCITPYPDSYQFYNSGLMEFRALNSGLGSMLLTRRYHYFNTANTGWGFVQLWDYGYSNVTPTLEPLALVIPDDDDENMEMPQ